MRRSIPIALSLSAMLCSCATHQRAREVAPQPESRCSIVGDSARTIVATSSGPTVSDSVAPGQLVGNVVDAETGKPLWAQVYFPARPMSGVAADSTGRFRVAIPHDAATAVVRSIGYARVNLAIPAGAGSGFVARIALRREPVCVEYIGGQLRTSAPGHLTTRKAN